MDTGGAGTFRGGVGVSTLYTPHLVEEISTTVLHSHSVMQPEAVGICGGLPAATNEFAILRGSNVWEELGSGQVPQELESLEGRLEFPPPLCVTSLKRGDVYRCITSGGGGYGDPLLRDPDRVLSDVLWGLSSAEAARTLYGVLIDEREKQVDMEGTRRLRKELREARRGASAWGPKGSPLERGPARLETPMDPSPSEGGPAATRIGEYLAIVPQGGGRIHCRACGEFLCAASADFKDHLLHATMPLQAAGPRVDPRRRGEAFCLHAYFCPSCLIQVHVEVGLKEETPIPDILPRF